MEKTQYKKEAYNTLLTVIASAISALGLYVFVYPSAFAPSGVDGIATMLQELTGWNAGYFTLLINLPLLIAAWFLLKKKYVIYTLVFTLLSSVMLVVMERVEFYQYQGTYERLIAAIISGILLGARTGIMLKLGASSGGIDVVACMVQKKLPYKNIENIISIICYAIMAVSYFVYKDLNCILLAVIQMMIFEKTTGKFLKDNRNAMEFKIVTKNPLQIKEAIIYNLKHGATIVESKGMFTEDGSAIVFTVVNNRQIPDFLNLLKQYPDTFVYYVEVAGVQGNFRWGKYDIAK